MYRALALVIFLSACGSDQSDKQLPLKTMDESGLTFQYPGSWHHAKKSIKDFKGAGIEQQVSVRKGTHIVTVLRMKDKASADQQMVQAKENARRSMPETDSLGEDRWTHKVSQTKVGGADILILWKHYKVREGDTWFYVWAQTTRAVERGTGKIVDADVGAEVLGPLFASLAYQSS